MTEVLWYVKRNEQIKGPFPIATIQRSILLGRIRDDDAVSQDQRHWQAIQECKALYPDILLDENTSEHEIQEARIRLDERSHDRRACSGNNMADERRKARDRRQSEDEEVLELRERRARVMQSLRERPNQLNHRGFFYLSMLGLILLSLAWFNSPGRHQKQADCHAAAGPGMNWSSCAKQAVELENQDLQGAVLRNSKLIAANFMGANLLQADLAYADLSSANLSHAVLLKANLKGANLKSADLSYADLKDVDLTYADLSNANLGGAELGSARLDNAIWLDGRICAEHSIGQCRTP